MSEMKPFSRYPNTWSACIRVSIVASAHPGLCYWRPHHTCFSVCQDCVFDTASGPLVSLNLRVCDEVHNTACTKTRLSKTSVLGTTKCPLQVGLGSSLFPCPGHALHIPLSSCLGLPSVLQIRRHTSLSPILSALDNNYHWEVPRLEAPDLTQTAFFQYYMQTNTPLVIMNATRDWSALGWTNAQLIAKVQDTRVDT